MMFVSVDVSVVALALCVAVLLLAYEVPPLLLAGAAPLLAPALLADDWRLLLLLVVPPVAYATLLAVVAGTHIADYARTYRELCKWPLGRQFFDRVLVTLLAPAKAHLGARTMDFDSEHVRLHFRQRFWLQNPFASGAFRIERSISIGTLSISRQWMLARCVRLASLRLRCWLFTWGARRSAA